MITFECPDAASSFLPCILTFIIPQVKFKDEGHVTHTAHLAAIFLLFCYIFVNNSSKYFDRNLKFYLHVRLCTAHMHTNNLGNTSSIHYLAATFLLFLLHLCQ